MMASRSSHLWGEYADKPWESALTLPLRQYQVRRGGVEKWIRRLKEQQAGANYNLL